MKRVSKSKILEIINQINDEMLNDKDNPMSIYECFDFNEEFKDDIARALSKAIALNSKYQETILDAMMNVVAYCGSVVPEMILKRLFKKKMLPTKVKYISLLKWLEDAWIMCKINNKPFTIRDLEECLKKCNHSCVKQKIKDVLDMFNEDE
jgi:hypothetical protein